MRYSRLRRKKTRQRYAAFILIAILLFGSLYVIFAGTVGKFVSNLINPILSSFDRGEGEQAPADGSEEEPRLTIPDKPAEDVVKITDTIKANTMTMRAIQMGAFTAAENAAEFAEELRTRGGAGYMIEDQFFRVLAIGFISEADARQVREQLKEEGIDSQIYEIASPGANMQVTATESNVSAIKEAFALWEDRYMAMEEVIVGLDSDKISAQQAYETMTAFRDMLAEQRDTLETLAATQENNTILTGLRDLYQQGTKTFDDILSENSSDRIAISAKIKYTYIDMIMQYKQYMEQITRS